MKNLLDESPYKDVHGGSLRALQWTEGSFADRDVLDIGCGFGWFTASALEGGARSVVGIEPSEDDLATARKHLTDPRVRLDVGSAIDIPAEDESIDLIGCWEVLEHIPKQTEPRAFSEIARVLRPGGSFFMSTPYSALASRVTDPAWWLIGHRHYSQDRIRGFAEDAGLEVEEVFRSGSHWQVIYLWNMYLSKWVLRRRPLFERWMHAKLDAEYSRRDGYTNVFMRCRKPA